MKIADWLADNTDKLAAANVVTSRLDCLILLSDALGQDKAYVLSHLDDQLSSSQLQKLNVWIARRETHEPLAYIRGHCEFYGRRFAVNHHVLVPRPESEDMIDLLLQNLHRGDSRIIDLGCGSGALGITTGLATTNDNIVLVDIDPECLNVAKNNAQKYQLRAKFIQSDLLENLSDMTVNNSYILANLPYVPDGYSINKAATHEPRLALFSGHDGLDLYRKLFAQLRKRQLHVGALFCESLPTQHSALRIIAKEHGFRQIDSRGLIQVFSLMEPLPG